MTAPPFIETVHHGTNATLIAEVSKLYLPDHAVVADVTFGKGSFWRKTDTTRFTLLASDLQTCPDAPHDFRALPYAAGRVDILVLDPPYLHDAGVHPYDHQYRNSHTTKGFSHDAILELYQAGMVEARRVLKPSGSQLWLKCKDEIASGKPRFSHLELHQRALTLGFQARDLFVLVARSPLLGRRWTRQLHARKTHSYLFIFTLGRFRMPRQADTRRPCAYCGRLFTPQRSTGKYCKPSHRQAAYEARHLTLTPISTGEFSVRQMDLF